METVVVSVRLDERLVRALDAQGRERSEVIREALEEWVRRQMVSEMVREHQEAYRRSPVHPGEFDWLFDAAVWPDEEGRAMVSVAPTRPAGRRKKRRRRA